MTPPFKNKICINVTIKFSLLEYSIFKIFLLIYTCIKRVYDASTNFNGGECHFIYSLNKNIYTYINIYIYIYIN